MSRRKRHVEDKAESNQIEWLKHRQGYPSPAEREKIIRLRNQLQFEIMSLALVKASPEDSRYRELIRKYGKEEVLRAEKALREGLDMPSRVADDARSYRDYRLRYARFGAGLTFFTAKEVDELYESQARQFTENLRGENANRTSGETEVERLLLIDWRNWEDITPLAVPPRPADYNVAQPASYPMPVAELLEWGTKLDRSHEFADEKEYFQWKKFIPALTRMALDPGLLNGWPSDNASWAPWHAIHALGNLQAWESAAALAELADRENDWLSDHLPHTWADMGREVEPILWMIVEDRSASAKRRGLAAEGLYMMTDDEEVISNKVVKGFEKMLRQTKTFDPTVNAYIILFLRNMEAMEDVYPVINEAFEQNRVDLDVVSPDDLEEYDFDQDDFKDNQQEGSD